jgi:hypothetical protein
MVLFMSSISAVLVQYLFSQTLEKYWTNTGEVLEKYWTTMGATPCLNRRKGGRRTMLGLTIKIGEKKQ